MKRRLYASLGVAVLLTGALAAAVAAGAPGDPNPAMNAADQTAWQLFMQVNAPGGGTNATFETWASDTDTFKPHAAFPQGATPLSLHPPVLKTIEAQELQKAGLPMPQVPPGVAGGELEETRRNPAAFDFIIKNHLESRSGLKAAFGKTLSFPVDAIEVKANWIAVTDVPAWTNGAVTVANAPKVFHVNTGVDHKQYALVSMHVISKATPNWTWATFEHRLNPGRCDVMACRDAFGAQMAVTPPKAPPGSVYPNCAKTPALTALFVKAKLDSAFTNYCLKGSQTDFADDTGLAARLGNSVTEAGFVESSSCMTCHSRSAWNASGQPTSRAGFVNFNPLTGPLGSMDPHWYWSTTASPPIHSGTPGLTRIGTSADFVWSIPLCAYDDSNAASPQQSPCSGK